MNKLDGFAKSPKYNLLKLFKIIILNLAFYF